MDKNIIIIAVSLVWLILPNTVRADGQYTTVLDAKSFWQCHITYGTDLVRNEKNELFPIHPENVHSNSSKQVNGKRIRTWSLISHHRSQAAPLPPEDWFKPDFNDSEWTRQKGPFASGPYGSRRRGYKSIPLICLRGKFWVEDPARTGDLDLSVSYLGGIIVYMNGKEAARSSMPQGKTEMLTPALDYPAEAYFTEDGYVLNPQDMKNDPKTREAIKARVRHLSGVNVPASMLRKGINIIALELHRSPFLEAYALSGKVKGSRYGDHPPFARNYCWWPRIGLTDIRLTAQKNRAALFQRGTGKNGGFRVWTMPVFQTISASVRPDPYDRLQPLRICGVRNGGFSGQIIVSSDRPIQGLRAKPSSLKGPGTIPSEAVQLRYAVFDGGKYGPEYFDSLEETPPEEIPCISQNGAIQPVLVTVNVPPDTQAGDYTGTVTVGCKGSDRADVPVKLRVTDWTLPDPQEFSAFMGIMQSPDTLSMYYNVPMWSEKHWELIDRSFKLLGEIGNKTVYVTAQYKTHFGNEQSMIHYTRSPDGRFKPDFSIAEKYLDSAIRHQGKIPVVGLYIWRSPWSSGNYAGYGPRGDRTILLTVKDPKTGTLTNVEGPKWGTPECVELWKPVVQGMRNILKKHGMEKALMFGIAGDYTPTDTALEDLDKASGNSGIKWIFHSHATKYEIGNQSDQPISGRKWGKGKGKTYKTGYIASAWGGKAHRKDPELLGKHRQLKTRGYGWKTKIIRVQTRRAPCGRLVIEQNYTSKLMAAAKSEPEDAGLCGFGRTGADFWPVLGKGKRKKILAGRYPETAWGQLAIRCCGNAILGPGKNGPVATYRSEMLRENLQEIEARIFLEKILLDPNTRKKVGQDFALKAQDMLDDRVRAAMRGYPKVIPAQPSEISSLSRALYATVAEAAGKVGN